MITNIPKFNAEEPYYLTKTVKINHPLSFKVEGNNNAVILFKKMTAFQENDISNNIFINSKAINMHLVVGEPIVNVLNNSLHHSDKLVVTGNKNILLKIYGI